mmetsp:Transcript_34056/g.112744  ORF Transcript_34056/g.112744 Transcript_34056/m.112744 type:complete len:270 (-) Transcript_34056:1211-2020(-)
MRALASSYPSACRTWRRAVFAPACSGRKNQSSVAIDATNSRWCEMHSRAPRKLLSPAFSASRLSRSRWLVGSSSTMRCGSAGSTCAARISRTRSPPERSPTRWPACSASETAPRHLRATSSDAPGTWEATYSAAVMSRWCTSCSRWFCLRYATRKCDLRLTSPERSSAPPSASLPTSASTSVDFPTPLEPRMAILAPASTASVTSLSTAPRPGRPMLASSSRSRGAPPDSGVPARNSKTSVRSKARRACTRAVASEALSLSPSSSLRVR